MSCQTKSCGIWYKCSCGVFVSADKLLFCEACSLTKCEYCSFVICENGFCKCCGITVSVDDMTAEKGVCQNCSTCLMCGFSEAKKGSCSMCFAERNSFARTQHLKFSGDLYFVNVAKDLERMVANERASHQKKVLKMKAKCIPSTGIADRYGIKRIIIQRSQQSERSLAYAEHCDSFDQTEFEPEEIDDDEILTAVNPLSIPIQEPCFNLSKSEKRVMPHYNYIYCCCKCKNRLHPARENVPSLEIGHVSELFLDICAAILTWRNESKQTFHLRLKTINPSEVECVRLENDLSANLLLLPTQGIEEEMIAEMKCKYTYPNGPELLIGNGSLGTCVYFTPRAVQKSNYLLLELRYATGLTCVCKPIQIKLDFGESHAGSDLSQALIPEHYEIAQM